MATIPVRRKRRRRRKHKKNTAKKSKEKQTMSQKMSSSLNTGQVIMVGGRRMLAPRARLIALMRCLNAS